MRVRSILLAGLPFLVLCGCARKMAPQATAMAPTIKPGDRFHVDFSAYRSTPPARWDVVVLRFADAPRHEQVSRIVGLPGETVSFADGFVLIDGKRQRPGRSLSHLRYAFPLPGVSSPPAPAHPFAVPPDSYYVLGDNPNGASDSRLHGSVRRRDILGKVAVPNRK